MEAYHTEDKGIQLEQKRESSHDPVGLPIEDREAIANDNEPASKEAMDAFAAIEKQINEFRIRHINQQLAELEEEEGLLDQDLHPDQNEPLAIIRKFVNDKLQPEEVHHKYSIQNANFNLKSRTELLHSQYSQEARALREKKLDKCHDELHKIHKLNASEEQKEKEATESPTPKGKFGAYYETDDRGMFVTGQKIAENGKRGQRKWRPRLD
ncbi:hypothetical protein E2P81_ATG04229 [Venturia nashicola]|nr:hypothetical protein E2P81_ATG04229 [Venturia nashicola]